MRIEKNDKTRRIAGPEYMCSSSKQQELAPTIVRVVRAGVVQKAFDPLIVISQQIPII